jgi:hypothetical protein
MTLMLIGGAIAAKLQHRWERRQGGPYAGKHRLNG